jgi:ATP-dependent DNA ligase
MLSAEDFLLDGELVATLREEGQASVQAMRATLRRELLVRRHGMKADILTN